MFEIVESKVETDERKDFVAIGYLISDETEHSAFIIQYRRTLYEFHYTGSNIEFEEIVDDYYHKLTFTVHPDEVPAFISMCEQIKKKANPIYGFFYSGELYDKNGGHFGNKDLGERMTCVGFCLNVLKGFLDEDYLEYADWDESTHEDLSYLEGYCKKYKIDITKVRASHRRIAPIEFLASGFFENIPIRKVQIDNTLPHVYDIIDKKNKSRMN